MLTILKIMFFPIRLVLGAYISILNAVASLFLNLLVLDLFWKWRR